MSLISGTAPKRRVALIAVAVVLASATAMLYSPIANHEFINYDDRQYILENPHVASGLTGSGIVWSFQCGYASNWHPLTWISHMLDCSLFGLHPAGHHLVNLVFHAANAVLLLLWLNQMTGSVWRSAFVAAFFAWHPLRVESVAWASERKDVLSALFWILTLMAYVRYCRQPGRLRYLGCLALFALGLMAKPMLVTLPFVMLLLDFWPLRRLGYNLSPAAFERAPVWPLIREKMPFFALTLVASLLTYLAQQGGGAMRSWVDLPLPVRCANALISYVRYIAKTFWPIDLAVIYPYDTHGSIGLVVACASLLAALSVGLAFGARRFPYLIVGWLWYLGSLIPTIGLVQVGPQAMADRYTYIPCIGLLLVIVWGLNDLLAWASVRRWLAGFGTAALAGCLLCTSVQLKCWQNTEKLFRHAIEVTKDNYLACDILGSVLQRMGKKETAFGLFVEAARLEPHYPLAQYNLGTALMDQGKWDEAISHFASALNDDPQFAEPHNNWGKALLDQGRVDEAAAHFSEAARLKPGDAEIRYNLGTVLLKQSKVPEAIAQLTETLRLKPDYPAAHQNLALALMSQGKFSEGIAHFSEVVRLEPKQPRARLDLGIALLDHDQPGEAEVQLAEALRLRPEDAPIQCHLATALIRQHKSKDAVSHYREALRLQADNLEALNGLAWILACEPDPGVRVGNEAVRLAERACELTQYRQSAFMVTLAAAYAEAGRFAQAVAGAQKARDLALAAGDREASARAEQLLKLFESNRTVGQTLDSSSGDSH